MNSQGKCGATVEGHKFASGVVMWRGSCRNRPLKGFDHCRYHLTFEERDRRAEALEALRRKG